MAIYKRNNSEKKGKVTYNTGIVKGIVALAISEVSGVAIKKGKKGQLNFLKVNFNEDVLNIEINIDVIYGYNVPDVAFNVQQSVKHNIESMSKYKVDSVDVFVSGVVFDENHID
ncbi:MAG: Asp23/Gls24 family envelope stress response protein [Clostridia bacterium]|nr:Asp23/Gls24 family envelope stress response protein [Clostridia bacterium]